MKTLLSKEEVLTSLDVRYATEDDLSQCVLVEQCSWPEDTQADEARFRSRQERDCLLVAEYAGPESDLYVKDRPTPVEYGQILGTLSFQIPKRLCPDHNNSFIIEKILDRKWCCQDVEITAQMLVEEFGMPPDYWSATDNGFITETHDPGGDVVHLMSTAVSRDYSGLRIVDRLMTGLKQAAQDQGIPYIYGVTRIPTLSRRTRELDIPDEEYVRRLETEGLDNDPVLRYQLRVGGIPICPWPDYMPEDRESNEWGYLFIHPVPWLSFHPQLLQNSYHSG